MAGLQIQPVEYATEMFPASSPRPGGWTEHELETLVGLLGSWMDFSQICNRLGRLPEDVIGKLSETALACGYRPGALADN